MKKIYLLTIVSMFASTMFAQITLTNSTSKPSVGSSFEYIVNPSFTFNVSQSGANQIWDFSSATGTSATYNYKSLSNSSQSALFPLANLVESTTGVNAENYYSCSNSGITLEGHFISGIAKIIYSDKYEFIKFPITYNNVFNETFAGTVQYISTSQTLNRIGTIKIHADGYGDLILPYTTVHNVLRVQLTHVYVDKYNGNPFYSYVDTVNLWYNATTKNYIASTSVTYANGSLSNSQAIYMKQSDLVTGINELPIANNQISIYPNPANDYFFVDNTTKETLSIDIFDIRGVFIKTENIQSGKNKLDVSSLKSGIYIIKYAVGSNFYTKKLVVE